MAQLPIKCQAVSVVVLRREEAGVRTLLMRRNGTLEGEWCQVAGRLEEGEKPGRRRCAR